ncbi:MAG: septum formation initiator family protein [Defluviitaleaceae bacterium]|nr:septum formation initiator family protein [Defluviitaleaceae bacterium]
MVNDRSNKPRKRKKTRLILYFPFWMLMIIMFLGLISMQYSQYELYRQELDRLTSELEQEYQLAGSLEDQHAFIESDAYIEQRARVHLGFIRQDEIIFVNVANSQ